MNNYNQLLLNFNQKQNFNYEDYFVSDSISTPLILLINGRNGKKIYSIFMEKSIQGNLI